jgi:uncharacterized protein (TIGR00369 family)
MDFNDHVGYRQTGFVDDEYLIELKIGPQHLNRYGSVHGGVLFSMLDTAMSHACFDTLSAPSVPGVTLELKINYLKSVSGGVLTAHGRLVNRTRRTAYAEGYILNEADELVAKASGTMYLTETR